MENAKIKAGTVIKGRDLKDKILCKVLHKGMVTNSHYAFQYKIGLNEDPYPLETKKDNGHGLYFNKLRYLTDCLGYGDLLAFVTVPDDEDVYVVKDFFSCELRARRLIVRSVMSLSDPATWEYLFHLGYQLDNCLCREAIYLASKGYLDALRYIYKNGADISTLVDEMLKEAAEGGHLNIVKFLFENAAKISWGLDEALKWAASGGYLETVRFLVKHGADVTVSGNYAIRHAAAQGHFDVVKYLCDHGADVAAHRNDAIKSAAIGGHLSVVRLLQEHGADIMACKIKRVYDYVYDMSHSDKEYKAMYNYLLYMIKYGSCCYIEHMARANAS